MRAKEIEDLISSQGSDDLPTFGGKFEGGIHCQQVPDEIAPCIMAILESGEEIRSYLEIGVAAGGTTFLFDHFFQLERVILVDDNKHHKAGLRPGILKGLQNRPGLHFREFIGKSCDEDVLEKVRPNAQFDVVFIDGDHLYPGVKLDTVLYLPFLRRGGFLVLHDSAMPEWGVMRIVRELKADPEMEFVGEFISKVHPKPLGLALFRKVSA